MPFSPYPSIKSAAYATFKDNPRALVQYLTDGNGKASDKYAKVVDSSVTDSTNPRVFDLVDHMGNTFLHFLAKVQDEEIWSMFVNLLATEEFDVINEKQYAIKKNKLGICPLEILLRRLEFDRFQALYDAQYRWRSGPAHDVGKPRPMTTFSNGRPLFYVMYKYKLQDRTKFAMELFPNYVFCPCTGGPSSVYLHLDRYYYSGPCPFIWALENNKREFLLSHYYSFYGKTFTLIKDGMSLQERLRQQGRLSLLERLNHWINEYSLPIFDHKRIANSKFHHGNRSASTSPDLYHKCLEIYLKFYKARVSIFDACSPSGRTWLHCLAEYLCPNEEDSARCWDFFMDKLKRDHLHVERAKCKNNRGYCPLEILIRRKEWTKAKTLYDLTYPWHKTTRENPLEMITCSDGVPLLYVMSTHFSIRHPRSQMGTLLRRPERFYHYTGSCPFIWALQNNKKRFLVEQFREYSTNGRFLFLKDGQTFNEKLAADNCQELIDRLHTWLAEPQGDCTHANVMFSPDIQEAAPAQEAASAVVFMREPLEADNCIHEAV